MYLKKQAASGIKWTTAAQISKQVLQLLTTVVVARIISPADFGLMGMAMTVIGFVALIKDFGTSAAIIQSPDLPDTLKSSVFWLNLAVGALACFTLIVLSPIAALFFHAPRLEPVLKGLSITFFISALGLVHQAIMERSLSFHRLAKIETLAAFLGALVAICAAIRGSGVWSLVFQSWTISIVTTALVLVSGNWIPTPCFSWNQIRSIRNFSLNLTANNVFNFLMRNADNILIGRFLGERDLGFYTLAYRLMTYPLQSVTDIVSRVMFPVYSRIDNPNECQYLFLRAAEAIALVTFPMMLGIMSVAKPFVLTVFGEKWRDLIVLLEILAPVGLLQSVAATVGTIYLVKRRTDWMLLWSIGASAATVTGFALGLHWGINGVAASYLFVNLCLFYPNFFLPFKLIDLPINSLNKALWRSLACGLVMFASVSGIENLLTNHIAQWAILVLSILTGITSYILISLTLNKDMAKKTFILTLERT